jgi:hypothetical protein
MHSFPMSISFHLYITLSLKSSSLCPSFPLIVLLHVQFPIPFHLFMSMSRFWWFNNIQLIPYILQFLIFSSDFSFVSLFFFFWYSLQKIWRWIKLLEKLLHEKGDEWGDEWETTNMKEYEINCVQRHSYSFFASQLYKGIPYISNIHPSNGRWIPYLEKSMITKPNYI